MRRKLCLCGINNQQLWCPSGGARAWRRQMTARRRSGGGGAGVALTATVKMIKRISLYNIYGAARAFISIIQRHQSAAGAWTGTGTGGGGDRIWIHAPCMAHAHHHAPMYALHTHSHHHLPHLITSLSLSSHLSPRHLHTTTQTSHLHLLFILGERVEVVDK